MKTRWDVFRSICQWVRPLIDDGQVPVINEEPDWNRVVEAASAHLITPALAWCLRGAQGLPSDLSSYLDAILELSQERNRNATGALAATLQSLNEAGIEPVLLKGAASLVDGIYPDDGIRIFSDIDLLVGSKDLEAASAALNRAGFAPVDKGGNWVALDSHQLPIQINPKWLVGVEVHRRILGPGLSKLVPANSCIDRVRRGTFRGHSLFLPNPTDRAAHNIAHAQLQDGGHGNVPQLRQLLDLAMIRRRYENEIDWIDIEARFKSAGFPDVIPDILRLSHALLGQSMPAGVAGPARDPVRRLERKINFPRSRMRFAIYIAGVLVRRFSAQPALLLNLLRPASWPRRWNYWARQIKARRG